MPFLVISGAGVSSINTVSLRSTSPAPRNYINTVPLVAVIFFPRSFAWVEVFLLSSVILCSLLRSFSRFFDRFLTFFRSLSPFPCSLRLLLFFLSTVWILSKPRPISPPLLLHYEDPIASILEPGFHLFGFSIRYCMIIFLVYSFHRQWL